MSISRVGADERARLHQVASALAGVRAATTLLNMPGDLGDDRREAMAAMVQGELSRLERMLELRQDAVAAQSAQPSQSAQSAQTAETGETAADGQGAETEVIDLDAVVGAMALAHEAKGTTIEWRPSRMLALGDADQLTDALNVLLDNAASHGHGTVRIEIDAAGSGESSVEIAVTDDGPGVAPEIRRRIFAWGVKGPRSTGQGIGLHLARDLMERQGGYLELAAADAGARFVLGIPMLGRVDTYDAYDTYDPATPVRPRGVAA